jgi:hypothetical protein
MCRVVVADELCRLLRSLCKGLLQDDKAIGDVAGRFLVFLQDKGSHAK